MEVSSQKITSNVVINKYAKQGQHSLIRTGNLFVIHFTKEMFIDNGSDNVYFHQCLETYINILKQKLTNNKDDYMGLMFCNTAKSDEGVENILTIQELASCTTDMYTKIMKLYEKDASYYMDQISDIDCSISNVLLHAIRAYDTLTITTVARTVIFLTCQDDPASNDSKERHRIRINAKNFKNINVRLSIVGLGENWNYNIFYKEIEMLSENIAGRDVKQKDLADLEEEIIRKAHVLASLEFRIRNDAKIKISLQRFIACNKTINTKYIAKDTNEPLDSYSWYSYDALTDDEEFDDENDPPENIKKMQRFGGRDIVFTWNEVKSLRSLKSPGIDLLGFKKMDEDHPTWHIERLLFMGCDVKSSSGELKFFVSLLSKMAKQNLMAICALTFKLNEKTRLYRMWPSLDLGGFYLYRMPFKEDVRNNLISITDKYKFNENDNIPPITEEKLNVMKLIVHTLCVDKYPINFENARIQRIMKFVETIALDLPSVDPPNDNTLPDVVEMRDKLNEMGLIEKFNDTFEKIYESISRKNTKASKLDEEYVNNILMEGNFNKLTAVTIKSILKTLGLSSSGHKADLICKLNEYKEKHF